MDPMSDQKSPIISINDILNELMSENKRLFNELLFANICLNELKTHLINIHSKYETIIDNEDKQRWEQLRVPITPRPSGQELASKLNLNTICWQLLTKQIGKSDVQMKSSSDNQYVCPIKDCHKEFKQRYDLMRHSLTHQKKTFRCHLTGCRYETRISGRFTRHLATHSSDGRFVCPFIGCQKLFKTRRLVTYHLNSHKNGPSVRCAIIGCNETFATDYDRLIHQKSVHMTTNTIHTNVIYKTQVLKPKKSTEDSGKSGVKLGDTLAMEPMSELLAKHRSERDKCFDLKTKSYKCPLNGCNGSFENGFRFYQHLKTTHRLRQYRCEHEDCGKSFRQLRFLVRHSAIHSTVKPFKCQHKDCHYETHLQKLLERHSKTHSKDKAFVCDFTGCEKSYKNKISLDNHVLTHTSVFKCNVCHKILTSAAAVDSHRRTIHSNEPTFKCSREDCSELFYTPSQRRRHMTDAHKMKPLIKRQIKYPCDWPGCEWRGKDLKKHKRLHTGEKPFICEWPDCGKRFRKKDALNDHMNVHNNVKPHACHWPGCQYRATNSANVIKHRKQVHKT